MRKARQQQERRHLIDVLEDVALGGWQDRDGEWIAPSVAREAIAVLRREWAIDREEVSR